MEPSLDFALILSCLLGFTGLMAVLDEFILKPRRAKSGKAPSWTVEYAASMFPVILFVWLLRSFVVQPYRVPTGSLEPTVMPGDFVLVNQFIYGIRIPVLDEKVISVSNPKRGDIVLFRWPPNPKIFLIKRLIGLPGDHIQYTKTKQLYINGKLISHSNPTLMKSTPSAGTQAIRLIYTENLMGIHHKIILYKHGGDNSQIDVHVPPHHYFVLGDNRDESNDSRFWGMVPEENFIGKGMFVFMNFDTEHYNINWHRIGTSLEPKH